jgi:hypothetical protein
MDRRRKTTPRPEANAWNQEKFRSVFDCKTPGLTQNARSFPNQAVSAAIAAVTAMAVVTAIKRRCSWIIKNTR